MPKIIDPKYIRKSETHKSVLVSLPRNLLQVLETIVPSYKRSALITSLLNEFVKQHGTDPVLQPSKKQKTKKNIKGSKKKRK